MIAIIDYGVGNLFSLCSSLQSIGAEAVVTPDPDTIRAADRIILPGVGAFGDAAEKLSSSGLGELLKEEAAKGKYVLGICLGMQCIVIEYARNVLGLADENSTEMDTATAIIPLIPAPNHTITIGANAVLGSAFNTTKNGSSTFDSIGYHQSKIAMPMPHKVPIQKPANVSHIVMPICSQIDPPEKYCQNILTTADGLLNKKASIQPRRAATSQIVKNPVRSTTCQIQMIRFCCICFFSHS